MTDREKIALLATKLMGWEDPDGAGWRDENDDPATDDDWNPLEDANHAKQVREKLGETHWLGLDNRSDGKWATDERIAEAIARCWWSVFREGRGKYGTAE